MARSHGLINPDFWSVSPMAANRAGGERVRPAVAHGLAAPAAGAASAFLAEVFFLVA
jgi:hypothetical protein